MKSVLTNFLRREEELSLEKCIVPAQNQYFAITIISIYCYLDGLSIHGAWSILRMLIEVMLEILGSEKSIFLEFPKNCRDKKLLAFCFVYWELVLSLETSSPFWGVIVFSVTVFQFLFCSFVSFLEFWYYLF